MIWESKKPNKTKFEALPSRDNFLLEEAFKLGQSKVELGDGAEADLELSQVLRPHKRDLRRTYHAGLWLQLRSSAHQQQLHVKLHNLQVDCQMADCIFPTILAPVPPPKSVAADKGQYRTKTHVYRPTGGNGILNVFTHAENDNNIKWIKPVI